MKKDVWGGGVGKPASPGVQGKNKNKKTSLQVFGFYYLYLTSDWELPPLL